MSVDPSADTTPLWDLFADVRVRFWVCPVPGHKDRAGLPTVRWVDDVAYCLTPGCGRCSATTGPAAHLTVMSTPAVITTVTELEATPAGWVGRDAVGGIVTRIVDGPGAVFRTAGVARKLSADAVVVPVTTLVVPPNADTIYETLLSTRWPDGAMVEALTSTTAKMLAADIAGLLGVRP